MITRILKAKLLLRESQIQDLSPQNGAPSPGRSLLTLVWALLPHSRSLLTLVWASPDPKVSSLARRAMPPRPQAFAIKTQSHGNSQDGGGGG